MMSSVVIAEPIRLPPFSGLWFAGSYKVVEGSQYETACEETIAEYIFDNVSDDPVKAAILYKKNELYDRFGKFPDSCSTNAVEKFYTFIPETFPITGDSYDVVAIWEIITSDPSNPVVTNVEVECKMDDSIFREKVYVDPHYDNCEHGSCYDICYGDILARSLNVAGFESLGHTGIGDLTVFNAESNENYRVLEFQKDETTWEGGVHTPYLKIFQAEATYWGSRFGRPSLSEPPVLTKKEGEKIIEYANSQRFSCHEYTLTRDWYPASQKATSVYDSTTKKWIHQTAEQCGKFRCDTFVTYAYLQGANILIPPGPTGEYTPYPIETYESLPYIRPASLESDASLDEINSLHYIEGWQEHINSLSYEDAFNEMIELYLDAPQTQRDGYAYLLLLVFERLSQDNNFSPKQRADMIWTYIMSYKNEPDLLNVFIDAINNNVFDSIEYISKATSLISEQNHPGLHLHTLSLITNIYAHQLVGMEDERSLKNVKIIQDFFKKQLKTQDGILLKQTINYSSQVLPYDELEKLLYAIPLDRIDDIDSASHTLAAISLNYLTKGSREWDAFWNRTPKEWVTPISERLNMLFSDSQFADQYSSVQNELVMARLQLIL